MEKGTSSSGAVEIPYFGGCPVCHSNDGYLNIGMDHWIVCDEHKMCWYVGSNLFSSWREETESDWERNRARLAGYEAVEPVRAA